MDRHETIAKLREIEARVAGMPDGSDDAVVGAIEQRLASARITGPDVATKLDVPDVLLIDLLFLLCDRYGVDVALTSKRSHRSPVIRAPRSFVETTFMPIYRESATLLYAHVVESTHALIVEAYRMLSQGPSLIVTPRSE
jgi:hypothetical protein